MAETAGKLALIINTASYDRVTYALSYANAAAALGWGVHVMFGLAGLIRLKPGAEDTVGTETAAWLRRQIALGIQRGNIEKISEQLETLKKLGGKLYACPAAMAAHNLILPELRPDVDRVCGVVEFLTQEAKGASIFYI